MSPVLVCRARGRPGQKRTKTLCGTPGAPGVNALGPVEEAPHTPSDGASVPSKAADQPLLLHRNVVGNTMGCCCYLVVQLKG